MRTRRTVTAAALALALVLGSGSAGWAGPRDAGGAPGGMPAGPERELSAGWRISDGASGPELVWRSVDPVPMGDARVEFYAGDRLLGRPIADRDHRVFRLDLTGTDARELTGLQARAGGRRLDAPAGTRRAPGESGPAPAPVATLPANPVDPGRPGTMGTMTGEYDLPGVRLPGMPEPVEMRAVVVAPKNTSGARPLVLFLHGRHSTCFDGANEDAVAGEWPCPAGSRPIPSHRGYLRAQELLASQGYVTVSISANGINGQDYLLSDGGAQARSSLVRLHLARWAAWAGAGRTSAPAIVRAAPQAEMSRVLLMGHSRGGEGVNRAALDSLSPPPADQDGYRGAVSWRIRGTMLIGPTIFGHNPAPDVPSVTILPGCDGDVSDLQGQMYVDATVGVSRGAALHSAVYVVGANHNFFNAEWTPGQAQAPAWDDSEGDPSDRLCSPRATGNRRLTATQQQAVGATYVAAAARLFVGGDDRVRPLLDGSGTRAPSADPAAVRSHAVGAARRPLLVPSASTTVTGGGARLCQQVPAKEGKGCALGEDVQSPHFVSFGGISPESGRYGVLMTWSRPGRTVESRPDRPVSIAGSTALALRLIVPPNSGDVRLDVAVTDAAGRTATLGRVRVDSLPGSAATASYWGQEVRVPVTAASRAGLDLSRIAKLRLVPRSASGRAWLVDAWGWRAGTPAPRPVALPRVDVGELTVDEGDSGERVYRVPVRVSGEGSGRIRLYLIDGKSFESTERVVVLKPGAHQLTVPISVRGNTRFDNDGQFLLAAKAVRGAVVGGYAGGLIVRNDDPMPKISVVPVADRVAEGKPLVWRVTLSEVADADIWADFAVIPPASGVELATTDVDPDWLREQTGAEPLPSRPLSQAKLWLWAGVPPGELTADISIPTVVDKIAEREERVALRQMLYPPGAEEPVPGVTVTGTVLG